MTDLSKQYLKEKTPYFEYFSIVIITIFIVYLQILDAYENYFQIYEYVVYFYSFLFLTNIGSTLLISSNVDLSIKFTSRLYMINFIILIFFSLLIPMMVQILSQ